MNDRPMNGAPEDQVSLSLLQSAVPGVHSVGREAIPAVWSARPVHAEVSTQEN